jgi:transcriptional regulator GlxA family with amidase domain
MYLIPKSSPEFNGTAPVRSLLVGRKRHFIFLLLPGANMLDFSAAIEPLRVCNTLNEEPVYSWSVISENGAPVVCSNDITFPVDGKLANTQPADQVLVCSGDAGYLDATEQTLQWLRKHARFGGAVAGVGTGAFTLARAGLAHDMLTLHWPQIPVFEEMFPDLECITDRTMAGKAISFSAGGSSSLDLILEKIQEDFEDETAERVAELCLHEFDGNKTRTQRYPISKRVGSRHPAILNIVRKMEQSIQSPISLDDLIDGENISKRQVERLFSKYLGTTPSRYYRNLRLERARSLLKGTDMSVLEVAIATGFSSVTNFSKLYRVHFGTRPSTDR